MGLLLFAGFIIAVIVGFVGYFAPESDFDGQCEED